VAITAAQVAAVWAKILGSINAIGTDIKRIDGSAVSLANRISAIESALSLGGDPDAAEFIAVAGISGSTQISAIKALVAGLKDDGIWSLLDLIYPFVGSTAFAHSLNLKDPQSFPITWGGSLSHTSAGVVGGSAGTGVGTTAFVPANIELYLGLYVGQSSGAQPAHDLGSPSNVAGVSLIYQWSDGNTYADFGGSNTGRILANTASLPTGYKAASKIGAAQQIFTGSSVAASWTRAGGPVGSTPFRLFRAETSPCPNRTYAAVIVGQGLTQDQHVMLYNRIQTFQAALGRAV
jgi:hypothetical protein